MVNSVRNYILLFISTFFFSCYNGTNEISETTNKQIQSSEQSNNMEIKKSLEKNNDGKSGIISGRSVIFYSLGKDEYKSFISRMGKHTKWEFDIIYNNFKKTADNAISSLKSIDIYSEYITDPIILFITNNQDTIYFDRTNDDYFVGQIIFNGKDSVFIEEGLMKADNLEELIKKHFIIKSEFNISPVFQVSDSFRYFQVPDSFRYFQADTVEVIIVDSIQE